MKYTIEIATDNYASTAAAVAGGADRIELCSALSEGGLTAGYSYLSRCREDFPVQLFPILRPRRGDFLYSNEEFEIIQQDVLFCRDTKMDGVVTGFLCGDGSIDVDKLTTIVDLASPMQVTFHRAFDRCRNPLGSLEQIIKAGCHRILTSGQQPKAADGADLIGQLINAAANRIVIMPGSGVHKDNIAAIARLTGAVEFHSSLRSIDKSNMQYIHPAFAGEPGDYSIDTINPDEVRALRDALL